MLGSFCLELMMTCRRCGNRVPVNGITTAVDCHQCGHTLSMNQGFWTKRFGPNEFNEVAKAKPRSVQEMGSQNLTYGYGFRFPHCNHCSQKLPLGALDECAVAGRIHCPGCGRGIRVRPADELCQSLHSGARFVVGETHRFDRDDELERTSKPIVFACMSCSAALSVDGSSRTVACGYCQASNYLPDGLWIELNPVPTMSWMYLICELTRHQTTCFVRQQSTDRETILALARDESTETRAVVAANRGKDPEVAELLARDPEQAVRRALAKSRQTPQEVAESLASDPDASVRAAVAGRPVSDDTLEVLAQDGHQLVRAAVAANDQISPQLLMQLSRDASADVRLAVLKNKHTPTELYRALSRDPDAEVAGAAKAVQAGGEGAGAGRAWRGPRYVVVAAGLIVAAVAGLRALSSEPGDDTTVAGDRARDADGGETQDRATEPERAWAAIAPVIGIDDPDGGDLIILRQLRGAGGESGQPGLELVAYVPEPDGLRHLWTRPTSGHPVEALDRVHIARAGMLVLATNDKGWATLIDPETGDYRGNSYRLPEAGRAACTADKASAWVASGDTGILMKGLDTGREVAVAARPAHCRDPREEGASCPKGLPDEVHCADPTSLRKAPRGTRYVLFDGHLRVAASQVELVAFGKGGRRLWRTTFDTDIGLVLPAGDRIVVLTSPEGSPITIVTGLDAATGTLVWSSILPGSSGEPQVAASSSRAYVLRGKRLHVITLEGGKRTSYRRDFTAH